MGNNGITKKGNGLRRENLPHNENEPPVGLRAHKGLPQKAGRRGFHQKRVCITRNKAERDTQVSA